ncbi:uncharacterized protein LOC111627497 [Centruroides sculpturatus]|uniref:uncharacterized protein LOC111627497 n=1 Tax=Centruroides sculpturatus TaxID=218467 RepID=UPI000C6DCC67|nr:uncharacterized protein LOC111627497 [Centruroides sculpturatus]
MMILLVFESYKILNYILIFYFFFSTVCSVLKINPKPCSNALGSKGTCMFVWDCIKTDGKHLGTCVDGFLFGSCCEYNTKNTNETSINSVTTTSTVSQNNKLEEAKPTEIIAIPPIAITSAPLIISQTKPSLNTRQPLGTSTKTTQTTSLRNTDTTTVPSTSTSEKLPIATRSPESREEECGISPAHHKSKVVGGTNAAFGAWPWQASVRRTSFFGFSSTHRCGGAIINRQWIATAGHCVDDLLLPQIRIRVGEYDFASVMEPYPYIERGVKKKVVHPRYNFFTYENDLALVKLEAPLDRLPHIATICLPSDTEKDLIGRNATVTGWGRLSEGGVLPSILQEVQVPVISNEKCKNMFLKAGRHEYIPEIFMCAGFEDGGRDSCQGDSGGPLQMQGEDGRWFLAGIISWGIGCAEPNMPGVCTRISVFKDWILQNITNTRHGKRPETYRLTEFIQIKNQSMFSTCLPPFGDYGGEILISMTPQAFNMAMWQCVLLLWLLRPTDGQGHNSSQEALSDAQQSIQNIKCPGDCVNLFASFLCDRVLDQVKCDDDYSRCCVAEDMIFGTEVVTSPPLPEEFENATTTTPSTTTLSTYHVEPTSHPFSHSKLASCPGSCVDRRHSASCEKIAKTVCSQEGKDCCSKNVTISETKPDLCPGTCVSALFSLLCDHVAHEYFCADGGKCCVPPTTTTTLPPINPCPGNCIPTLLSGMCNRPSLLIVKTTDCPAGTICCYTPVERIKPTTPPSTLPTTPIPKVKPNKANFPIEYMCPGTCINTLLRFTCVKNHIIYNRFNCNTPGTVCCVSIYEVNRFEQMFRRPHSPSRITNYTIHTNIKAPSVRIPNPYMCGIKGTDRRQAKIIGGLDSLPGEWCWQVALINSQNQYLCGGALIGTQWVLTAAHCITNIVRNGDALFIRAGENDLTQQKQRKSTSETKRVITTYIHHNHNSQTLDNDIALLKLQLPVELNKNICLICLPARGVTQQAGKLCTVTGYGYQGEAGPIALKVRQAQLPIIDERECTVQINAVTEKLFVLPASSFCAGGKEGEDACQGDGGGPLVCEVDGFYELTGIVSWGFGCGRQDVPGIYVKVSSFIGWINQIISVNNL